MRKWQVWVLAAALLAGVFLVLGPDWLQDRTAEQSRLDLALVYGIWRWGTVVAAALTAVAAFAAASLGWRASRWLRSGAVAVVAALLLCTALVWRARAPMWEPMTQVRRVGVESADFLSDADMVLGVRVGDTAVAYPTAIVAYHHVVNDVLAGEPYVVTY